MNIEACGELTKDEIQMFRKISKLLLKDEIGFLAIYTNGMYLQIPSTKEVKVTWNNGITC